MSALPSAMPEPAPARVLVVDDDEEMRGLLERAFAQEPFQCVFSQSAQHAQELIPGDRFSVVISDIRMPGMSGVDLLRFVRQWDPDISVIMMTGLSDMGTALETLRIGACDYITKPFDLCQIRRAVTQGLERSQLLTDNRRYRDRLERRVQERTDELNSALCEVNDGYRITLEALVTALDAREHETQAHSQRVREYAETLARQTGVPDQHMLVLGRGALLHDVGKIAVPDSILLKPGKLTPAEWLIMKKHPGIGHDILKGISFLSAEAEIVLAHQERWDGKGYPNGLAGKDIPLGARIFAVVDTVDAMTSDRPYRKALPMQAAVDEIIRCSGTQFDPTVVDAFLSIEQESWTAIREAVNRVHHCRIPIDVQCPT